MQVDPETFTVLTEAIRREAVSLRAYGHEPEVVWSPNGTTIWTRRRTGKGGFQRLLGVHPRQVVEGACDIVGVRFVPLSAGDEVPDDPPADPPEPVFVRVKPGYDRYYEHTIETSESLLRPYDGERELRILIEDWARRAAPGDFLVTDADLIFRAKEGHEVKSVQRTVLEQHKIT